MSAVMVYVTAGSREEAALLARTVIEEKLAACANILAEMTSVYRWQGEVCEEPEFAIVMKSRRDLIGRLTERIKALHSYDCPCVVALDISEGNPAFLDWIAQETA